DRLRFFHFCRLRRGRSGYRVAQAQGTAGGGGSGQRSPRAQLTMPITAQTLAILRQHDTPTICNALEHVMGGRTAEGFTKTPVVCADVTLPPIVGFAPTRKTPRVA